MYVLLYSTHVLPELRKLQSLCESILALRNDVAPDVSYLSAASNALRISDDTVSGIGEVGRGGEGVNNIK